MIIKCKWIKCTTKKQTGCADENMCKYALPLSTFLYLESTCNAGDPPWFNSWVGKILWKREWLPTPVFLGFPCGSAGKESACSVGDLGLISGLGGSPGEGKGYPLQYSGLEKSTDCIVPWGRKESDTTGRLSLSHCLLHSSF